MIKLNDITSLVHFDEIAHTYTRVSDGKELQGVTTMIRKMGLSPDYKDINEVVLQTAADRGHCVHALCDLVDENDHEVDEFDEIRIYQELTDKGIVVYLDEPYGMSLANKYFSLRKEEGLIPLASEYLVSDGENIASSVDLVLTNEEMQKNNEVYLVDIKTTSSIHYEPLSWQLSIYKRLFEAQNPNIKVKGLLGVWLPKPVYGEGKIFQSDEKPSGSVEELIRCFAEGTPFSNNDVVPYSSTMLARQNELIDILKAIDILKEKEKQFKEQLLKWMAENGHKKFENDDIVITRVLAGTTQKFDSAAFKKDNPEMYEKYLKTSTTSESIRIKIK